MAKDVIITPADGDIQFENASGVEAGKIEQSGDDLVLSNAVGDVLIGDGTADVYIGDGVNNVDIIFEQDGSIKGETAAGVTLTLGSNDTTLNITGSGNMHLAGAVTASSLQIDGNTTFTGDLTVGGKVTAQEFHTEFVSASIVFSSGSTKFGDTSDDVHSFTGSLNVLKPSTYGAKINLSTSTNTWTLEGGETGYAANSLALDFNGTTFVRALGTSDTRIGSGLSVGNISTAGPSNGLYVAGNVGIGTTTPGAKLHVNGLISGSSIESMGTGWNKFYSTSTYAIMEIKPSDTRTGMQPLLVYRSTVNGSANYLLADGSITRFGLYDGGAPSDVSGMVSIIPNNNTESPMVAIGDAGSGDARLSIGGNIRLSNTGSVNSYINAGNVGIGTVSPGYKLDISGSFAANYDTYGYIRLGNNLDIGANGNITIGNNSTDSVTIGAATGETRPTTIKGGPIYLQTSGQTRVFVDQDGDVGIGTIAPANKLHVGGNGQFGAYALIGSSISAGFYMDSSNGAFRANSTTGNKGFYFQSYNGSNTYMYIGLNGTYAGNVGIGTTNPLDKLSVEGNSSSLLKIRNTTNGGGASIEFNDNGASEESQNGTITYYHSDSASQGGGASFWFEAEPDTVLVVGNGTNTGRIAVSSAGSDSEVDYGFRTDVDTGMLRTSADNVSLVAGGVRGVGVGTTAVSLKYAGTTKLATTNTGIDVTGNITTSGDLTVNGGDIILGGTGRIQGIDTVSAGTDAANKTYVDNAVNGFIDGSGAINQVAYWDDANTISGESNFYWDEFNDRLGIGGTPSMGDIHVLDSGGGSVILQDTDTTDSWALWEYNDFDGMICSAQNGTTAANFRVKLGPSTSVGTKLMVYGADGSVRFNEYGSGNITGTATRMLGVTDAGVVVEEALPPSQVVDGTGTANYIPKWSDTDTLTDSIIYEASSQVGIGTTSTNATFVVQPSEISFDLAGMSNGQIALGNNTASGKAPTIGSRITSTGQPPLQVITGQPDTATVAGIKFSVREDNNTDFSTTADKPAFQFDRYTTNLMSIMRDGKVGIGTATPADTLHVVGTTTFEGGAANWGVNTQGTTKGTIHLDPGVGTTDYGGAITFGASDTGDGQTAQAGIYVRSDGAYGTKMYLSTTNNYTTGAQTAITILQDRKVGIGTSTPTAVLEVFGGNAIIDYMTAGRGYGTGLTNTSFGYQVYGTASGTNLDNTVFGYRTLYAAAGAVRNTAIGKEALRSLTSGDDNTAVGAQAAYSLTTGGSNVAIGRLAGYSNNNLYNVSIGNNAGYGNLSSSTIAIGYRALNAANTQTGTIAIGVQALENQTSGAFNLAVGYNALQNNTTGLANIALGQSALKLNVSGSYNLAMGTLALENNSGDYNFGLGYESLRYNTTGVRNTGFGFRTLKNATGDNNVAIGFQAGDALTSGNYNVAIGSEALPGFTTGDNNVAVGWYAGGSNTTNSDSVYIGYFARGSANGNTNEIVIGKSAIGNGSNTTTIGNSSTTDTIIPAGDVGIGTTSPSTKLHVVGDILGNGHWVPSSTTAYYMNFNTTAGMYIDSTHFITLNAGGNEAIKIDATAGDVTVNSTLSYKYPTATNQYRGEIVTFGTFDTKNGTILEGDVIVYTTAGLNSGWMKAQGNTTYSQGMLGIAMGTTPGAGILIKGFARNAVFTAGALGSPLFLSPTSAGDTTSVKPSTTGQIVRIVGHMLNPTNDEIFFNPDNYWVQV